MSLGRKGKLVIDGKLKCGGVCGYNLPVSEFHKSSRSVSGYRGNCKACTNKENRKSNPIVPSNMGIIGMYKYECLNIECKKEFTTTFSNQSFCKTKCQKRNRYLRLKKREWDSMKKEDIKLQGNYVNNYNQEVTVTDIVDFSLVVTWVDNDSPDIDDFVENFKPTSTNTIDQEPSKKQLDKFTRI